MNRAAIAAACLALVAGGFAAGRFLPASGPAASARKAVLYQCPMHPSFTSDTPGNAPCCGMALEPVHEGAGASHPDAPGIAGTVHIGAGLRQLQGVKVGAVEQGAVLHSLRLFGRVAPDETRVYTVNAALEGSIRELSGVTTGTVVRREQWLGAFFSADIRSPLQGYLTSLEASRMTDAARADAGLVAAAGSTPNRNAQFAGERLRGMGVSPRQLERMRQRRELPLTIDILSPADGVVIARSVTLGQRFDRGAEWFRIASLDRVWVLVDVLESDLPLVRPGAAVRVSVPGRTGTLPAVVSRIPPQFDAASRTMKVRLEMENPGALLRPDMFVDAELQIQRPATLTLPVDAVVDTGLRRTVFVEKGEGVFEPRAIETGWRSGGRVEVLSGLEAGDRVVLSGTFLVDSESQLRAAAAPVRGSVSRDPVCGMDVDEARARAEGKSHTHEGRTHYFCSDSCKATFAARPDGGSVPARVAGRP
jgi:Cu(I)/Ag(I) efflux system membrane fusion protein